MFANMIPIFKKGYLSAITAAPTHHCGRLENRAITGEKGLDVGKLCVDSSARAVHYQS